jgi:hypothetical protein
MQGKKEDAMRVSRRSLTVVIALVLGLALAVPAFAKPVSATVTLSQSAKVAGAILAPGEYRVVLDENKATFKLNGRVVAEATGQWKKADSRALADGVLRGADDQLREIYVGGRDSYFLIG